MVREEKDHFILTVDDTVVTISKRNGMIVSFMRDGRELLAEPMQLNAYRAPLDNDCNIRDNWKKIFADRVNPKIYRIESDGSRVSCHLAMGYSAYEPGIPCLGRICSLCRRCEGRNTRHDQRKSCAICLVLVYGCSCGGIWRSWNIWAMVRRKAI